jgi:hypothetical protein
VPQFSVATTAGSHAKVKFEAGDLVVFVPYGWMQQSMLGEWAYADNKTFDYNCVGAGAVANTMMFVYRPVVELEICELRNRAGFN